jgi:hypothetical protein
MQMSPRPGVRFFQQIGGIGAIRLVFSNVRGPITKEGGFELLFARSNPLLGGREFGGI